MALSQGDLQMIAEVVRQQNEVVREQGADSSVTIRLGKETKVHIKTIHAVILALLSSAGIGGFAIDRVIDAVDGDGKQDPAWISRVEAVENNTKKLSSEVEGLRSDLARQTISQLEQWRWLAIREGDPNRVRELERDLRKMREGGQY